MPRKVLRVSRKSSLEGSCLQQPIRTSAARPPATASVVMKRAEEAKKTLEDMPRIPKAEFKPSVHSGSKDRLNGKLSPGYTEPPKTSEDGSHSWVPR